MLPYFLILVGFFVHLRYKTPIKINVSYQCNISSGQAKLHPKRKLPFIAVLQNLQITLIQQLILVS